MKLIKHQNIASSVISVTSASTSLYSLMDTSGSVTNSRAFMVDANNGGPANCLVITPEDGDVRMDFAGLTPTAALGMLLSQGVKYKFSNIDLNQVNLIRTGIANASCSVSLGRTQKDEEFSAVAETVSLEASSVIIGEVTPARTVPESASDATGQDAYATVLTPSATFSRLIVVNGGGFPVTLSIDGGTTDTISRIEGGGTIALDGAAITTSSIQAKNASAGNNYTNLTVIVW